MGRPVTTGSLSDAEGGVRAYLHIHRLEKMAADVNVHCQYAPALLAAAEAMRLLSARNRRLGRDLGAYHAKRVLKAKGASLRPDCPQTPEVIADLAADQPVTVYIGKDPRRLRVTTRETLPRAAKVVGRFDAGTDYRVIERVVREASHA